MELQANQKLQRPEFKSYSKESIFASQKECGLYTQAP